MKRVDRRVVYTKDYQQHYYVIHKVKALDAFRSTPSYPIAYPCAVFTVPTFNFVIHTCKSSFGIKVPDNKTLIFLNTLSSVLLCKLCILCHRFKI